MALLWGDHAMSRTVDISIKGTAQVSTEITYIIEKSLRYSTNAFNVLGSSSCGISLGCQFKTCIMSRKISHTFDIDLLMTFSGCNGQISVGTQAVEETQHNIPPGRTEQTCCQCD